MAEQALGRAVVEAWRVADREAKAAVKREQGTGKSPAHAIDAERGRRFLAELRRVGYEVVDRG